MVFFAPEDIATTRRRKPAIWAPMQPAGLLRAVKTPTHFGVGWSLECASTKKKGEKVMKSCNNVPKLNIFQVANT